MHSLRFIMHSKKTAFIVEHDFIMAAYLADRVIVYDGTPSKEATAHTPQTLLSGERARASTSCHARSEGKGEKEKGKRKKRKKRKLSGSLGCRAGRGRQAGGLRQAHGPLTRPRTNQQVERPQCE
jgi:hypothetical protein